jgi:hypothetical protein
VKERARRQNRSAGEVISELARAGLRAGDMTGQIAEEGGFYGFEPLPRRGPMVSNELLDQLGDEGGD